VPAGPPEAGPRCHFTPNEQNGQRRRGQRHRWPPPPPLGLQGPSDRGQVRVNPSGPRSASSRRRPGANPATPMGLALQPGRWGPAKRPAAGAHVHRRVSLELFCLSPAPFRRLPAIVQPLRSGPLGTPVQRRSGPNFLLRPARAEPSLAAVAALDSSLLGGGGCSALPGPVLLVLAVQEPAKTPRFTTGGETASSPPSLDLGLRHQAWPRPLSTRPDLVQRALGSSSLHPLHTNLRPSHAIPCVIEGGARRTGRPLFRTSPRLSLQRPASPGLQTRS